MRRKTAAALLVTALLLNGCGDDDSMSQSEQDNLLDACRDHGHSGCHGAVDAFARAGCSYEEALVVLGNAARGVYGTPDASIEATVESVEEGAARLCGSA